MLSWDSILITVLHDDGVVVQDEYSYSLDAEQRMITFAGNKGDKGDPGEAATIQIGTVTTLPAGSSATVENVGTPSDARFNFGIPQGQKGDPGDPGSDTWGDITGTLSDQTDLQSALNAKQDTLTFDTAPTALSTNPVTSDGVYTALSGKQDTLTFDNTPSQSSDNPVKSSGIYTALDGKQDTLTFDSTPTASSTNPVTSGGIKTALDGKANNSIIADDFSESTSYSIGDYCIYDGALYRFTSAHSAGAWNSAHVTQVVVADELESLSALIESRMDYKVTGTVSASNYTLTDARINNEHWEVDWIYFATPSNVTSQIHWTTNISQHTVSLSATYTGATNVIVNMHWVQ